jgi:hypothetical protein
VPHGILRVLNTILYENEFQRPQIFKQTIASVFFPSILLYLCIYEEYEYWIIKMKRRNVRTLSLIVVTFT